MRGAVLRMLLELRCAQYSVRMRGAVLRTVLHSALSAGCLAHGVAASVVLRAVGCHP